MKLYSNIKMDTFICYNRRLQNLKRQPVTEVSAMLADE